MDKNEFVINQTPKLKDQYLAKIIVSSLFLMEYATTQLTQNIGKKPLKDVVEAANKLLKKLNTTLRSDPGFHLSEYYVNDNQFKNKIPELEKDLNIEISWMTLNTLLITLLPTHLKTQYLYVLESMGEGNVVYTPENLNKILELIEKEFNISINKEDLLKKYDIFE